MINNTKAVIWLFLTTYTKSLPVCKTRLLNIFLHHQSIDFIKNIRYIYICIENILIFDEYTERRRCDLRLKIWHSVWKARLHWDWRGTHLEWNDNDNHYQTSRFEFKYWMNFNRQLPFLTFQCLSITRRCSNSICS